MILLWKIRYLHRVHKQFMDRYLSLDTRSLHPTSRAAVEFVAETKSSCEREILKFKSLFAESSLEGLGSDCDLDGCPRVMSVGPFPYFEDETGSEISGDEIGRILTGDSTVRLVPMGAKQHDIDFILAEQKSLPIASVSLTNEGSRLLGYFLRDLRELKTSAFMKDGPGSLQSSGTALQSTVGNHTLETAVSDEEIRSFVTIFRRLYMTGVHDPASFMKVVPIFQNALGDNPYSQWVRGTANEYQRLLDSVPETRLFAPSSNCLFTTKRLIDVFLYTQYAHQPSAERQRQFEECLAQVHGQQAVLTWMFFTEMWNLALEILNAGKVIAVWFELYCDHHKITPDVLDSLQHHHSGLGVTEKEEARRARLFKEKAEQLAIDLWEQAGKPMGGPGLFDDVAMKQLGMTLNR